MKNHSKDRPSAIILGALIFTLAFLFLFGWLLSRTTACAGGSWLWDRLTCLGPNELGDTFAGAFAPVAFVWLVAAVMLQRKELAAQRQELRESREVAKQQVEESRKNVQYIGEQTKLLREQHEESGEAVLVNEIYTKIYSAIDTFGYIIEGVGITHLGKKLTPFVKVRDQDDRRRLLTCMRQVENFADDAPGINGDNGPIEFSDRSAFLRLREDILRISELLKELPEGDDRFAPLSPEALAAGIEALELLHSLNDVSSPFWEVSHSRRRSDVADNVADF